jgi:hypothetical protein
VGEQTGDIGGALDRAARRFDRDLTTRIGHLTTLVQPAIILLVALFVGLYVGWVAVSGFLTHATTFSWSVHDQKVARLQVVGNIDGLIVGGSNAVYSLSAEQMSELSGGSWFNAALPMEGANLENYSAFLDFVADSIDAKKVRTVVISSILLVRGTISDDFRAQTGYGFDGVKLSPSWLPSQSLWTLVADPPKIFSTLISKRGDLFHDAGKKCWKKAPDISIRSLNDNQIDWILETWLPLTHATFPQADIVVTVPAVYLVHIPDPVDSLDYVERLQSRIDAWIGEHAELSGIRITSVLEPNYDDPSILCAGNHHFNAEGRALRTDALYELMIEKGVIDG